MNVLMLNASYEPLRVIDFKRAIILLLQGKVEAVVESEKIVRSPSIFVVVPSVVRLLKYVRLPKNFKVSPTKKAIFRRDNGLCGYCGNKADTVDHIMPRSRGGKHTWENVVSCCLTCNQKKADKTLSELNWELLYTVEAPLYSHGQHIRAGGNVDWDLFLNKKGIENENH